MPGRWVRRRYCGVVAALKALMLALVPLVIAAEEEVVALLLIRVGTGSPAPASSGKTATSAARAVASRLSMRVEGAGAVFSTSGAAAVLARRRR